jgi:hypothetical protein
MREEIVAQIELDLARNADHDPARQEQKIPLNAAIASNNPA